MSKHSDDRYWKLIETRLSWVVVGAVTLFTATLVGYWIYAPLSWRVIPDDVMPSMFIGGVSVVLVLFLCYKQLRSIIPWAIITFIVLGLLASLKLDKPIGSRVAVLISACGVAVAAMSLAYRKSHRRSNEQ